MIIIERIGKRLERAQNPFQISKLKYGKYGKANYCFGKLRLMHQLQTKCIIL